MPDRISPAPRVSLASCPPYIQGKSVISGVEKPIKLSSNECPFGPSPLAIAAYSEAVGTLHRYPDGAQHSLREALAHRFSLEVDQLIAGNGSEELISLTLRAFVEPDDQVVLSQNGFVMTRIHALAQGAEIIEVEEADWHVSVDNILAAVTEKTKVVVTCPIRRVHRIRESSGGRGRPGGQTGAKRRADQQGEARWLAGPEADSRSSCAA